MRFHLWHSIRAQFAEASERHSKLQSLKLAREECNKYDLLQGAAGEPPLLVQVV